MFWIFTAVHLLIICYVKQLRVRCRIGVTVDPLVCGGEVSLVGRFGPLSPANKGWVAVPVSLIFGVLPAVVGSMGCWPRQQSRRV